MLRHCFPAKTAGQVGAAAYRQHCYIKTLRTPPQRVNGRYTVHFGN